MSKNRTIIATHNGFDYLQKSLEAERKFGRWPVTVIDTCSSDESFPRFALDICKDYEVPFYRLYEPQYDFGAYMYAAKLYPEVENFWFKHDSLYLKSSEFYDIIEKQLPRYDMIGWHFFAKWGSSFDNEEQRQWLIDNFGSDDYEYGFYGPNLAIKRSTLNFLGSTLKNVVVDNKIKQQAMERGWAIVAKNHNLEVLFLENFKGDVKSDAYKYFIKATHNSGVPRQ